MESIFDQVVGENLRSLRESGKVTQADLAGALFVDKEAIEEIESGKQKMIAFHVWKAAQFFRVGVQRILWGRG